MPQLRVPYQATWQTARQCCAGARLAQRSPRLLEHRHRVAPHCRALCQLACWYCITHALLGNPAEAPGWLHQLPARQLLMRSECCHNCANKHVLERETFEARRVQYHVSTPPPETWYSTNLLRRVGSSLALARHNMSDTMSGLCRALRQLCAQIWHSTCAHY